MKKIVRILCLIMAVSLPLGAQTVDPCSQNTTLTGGTTFTNNTSGSVALTGSPFSYEIYTQGGNNNQLIWYGANQGGGAAFKAVWNNPNDFLGRVGYYWNQNKSYTDYKNIYCDFDFTRSGVNTAGLYSYIGIYGWSQNPSATNSSEKLTEYYIVDDWFGNQYQSDTSEITTNTTGGSIVGNFTVDGATYDIIKNVRTGATINGNNQTFTQIFSIRRTPRKCGTISVTEHFKKWVELGLPFGSDMYECKFLVEAGGGTGWFQASYLTFSMEDQPRSNTGINTLTVSPSSKLYANVLSNDDINVNFTATGSGETELKLYNMEGISVASAQLQTVAGNNYSYTFNQGNFPSGFYVVWMNTNGKVEQVKVIVP